MRIQMKKYEENLIENKEKKNVQRNLRTAWKFLKKKENEEKCNGNRNKKECYKILMRKKEKISR